MPLRAGLPSCNLLYLARTGALDGAKGTLVFYTLGDYILRTLTGKEPHVHPTNAAATGLFDLKRGDWSGELTGFVTGGHTIRFPPVGEDGVDGSLGGVTIHAKPAIGDQQAALLGAGLNSERAVSFNLGTGAQVSVLTRSPVRQGNYQIRPFFNGRYIRTVPHIPSGRALNVYVRFVGDILRRFGMEPDTEDVWKRLLEAAETGPDTDMACDMSFFENAVTDRTTGSVTNIGEYDLSLGALMRTIFCRMADNFVSCAERVIRDPSDIDEIVFSGGVARKIRFIRERIVRSFAGDPAVSVAENETLTGICSYMKSEE